jgi:hypothetical protein
MKIAWDDDIAALLRRAAAGEVEAQSGLVDLAYAQHAAGEVGFPQAVFVAEAYARMAAAHGRPSDLRKLAIVLMDAVIVSLGAGDTRAVDSYLVEATALLDDLADEGDDEAGAMLLRTRDAIGGDLMAQVVELVRQVRAADRDDGQEEG